MDFAPIDVLLRIDRVEAVTFGHPVFKRAAPGVVNFTNRSISPAEVRRCGILMNAMTLVVYVAIILQRHLCVEIREVKPRTGDLDGERIASFQAEKVDPRFVI